MEWVVKEASMEEKTVSISEDLRDIGFPDDILSDLNAEDILACEGASQVIVETKEDQMGLKMTGIAVKVVENGSVWHIFHHFSWSGEYEFYGTEVLKLQPDWLLSDRFGMRYGKLSGRVLYERGDVTYTSPYYYMSEYDEAVGTTVWSMSAPSAYFAAFSFPNKGEGHRGYICYSVEPIVDDVPIPIIKNEFEYIHQNSQLQYPVVTAVEHCRYGVGDDSDYVTAEKWMQFGTENLQ